MNCNLSTFMSKLMIERGLNSNKIALVQDRASSPVVKNRSKRTKNCSMASSANIDYPIDRLAGRYSSYISTSLHDKSSGQPKISADNRWESSSRARSELDCFVWSQLCLRMTKSQRLHAARGLTDQMLP